MFTVFSMDIFLSLGIRPVWMDCNSMHMRGGARRFSWPVQRSFLRSIVQALPVELATTAHDIGGFRFDHPCPRLGRTWPRC